MTREEMIDASVRNVLADWHEDQKLPFHLMERSLFLLLDPEDFSFAVRSNFTRIAAREAKT